MIAEEPGLPGPIGEIDLLVVEEEALVEAAQFLEHGPPDKEERTDDLVHRAAVVDLAHGHPLARHQPGKHPGETTCPGHDHRQPGESGTGLLEAAVVLHHLAAADAHARHVRAGEESDRSVKGVRGSRVSGLRNSTKGAFPSCAPWLQAAANPRLCALRMVRSGRARSWRPSADPSAEALSTTTTRASAYAELRASAMESRHLRRHRPVFQLTTTMSRHGGSLCGTSIDLLRCCQPAPRLPTRLCSRSPDTTGPAFGTLTGVTVATRRGEGQRIADAERPGALQDRGEQDRQQHARRHGEAGTPPRASRCTSRSRKRRRPISPPAYRVSIHWLCRDGE
ncbi:hypothetical protein ACRAWF_22000 [Streptomyces sp. L7]